jgi:hypothetical protein
MDQNPSWSPDSSSDSDDDFFGLEQASATLSAIFDAAQQAEGSGIDVIALLGVQPRDPAPAPPEDESQDQD